MRSILSFVAIISGMYAFSQCNPPTIPTVISSSNNICAGQSKTLSITSGSLNDATNWSWYLNSCGTNFVGTGTTIVVTPTATSVYYVRGEGGCVNLGGCASIFVYAGPDFFVSATNPLCFGNNNGSISLSASGSPPLSYSWSPIASTSPSVTGLQAGSYTASVMDATGCVATKTILLTSPTALSLYTAPTQTVCYNSFATVYAQAAGGTAPFSYTMTNINTGVSTFSTGIPGGVLITTPQLTTTNTYTAFVVDNNGCVSGPGNAIVNVTPKLLAAGLSTVVCDSSNVTLVPNIISAGNGGPYTFNWSDGSSTVTTSLIALPANSPYSYSLVISDGCTIPNAVAFYTVTATNCTSLKEFKKDINEISFYPNPADQSVHLTTNGGEVKVKIYNIMGDEVTSKVVGSDEDIDISGLSTGLYSARFYENGVLVTQKKFVISR